MFALVRHHQRLIMHSIALCAVMVLVISSWMPQGLLLCLNHDGHMHVTTVVHHDNKHHDNGHHHADNTICNNCCEHDPCIDVVLELPDAHPHAHVFVQAGVPTVTVLSWSTELLVHDESHTIGYRLYRERLRDLGPPNDSLVRTVRLLV